MFGVREWEGKERREERMLWLFSVGASKRLCMGGREGGRRIAFGIREN